MSEDLPPERRAQVEAIIGRLRHVPGALLPILHAIQDQLGFVPRGAVPLVAQGLNLSRAEVHGVLTFYHHFRAHPPGRHVVQICRAEACQAVGASALERHAQQALGCGFHETTADGAITLEPVYCLGNCASGPSLRVGDDIVGHADAARFDALAAALRQRATGVDAAERGVAERHVAANAAGAQPPQAEHGVRVYVPADATASAAGADEVARAIQREAARRGVAVDLRRNGSRGLFWVEPLVEVQTARGRVGYGPVRPGDVASLFDAGFAGDSGGRAPHALALGPVDEIPYLARQRRITFQRIGRIEPLSLDDYRATGGYAGLARALSLSGAQLGELVVREVTDSGLRGRGGAAFPAGIKWETVRTQKASPKYVVCNADEGDSGTFADRLLMEADPYSLIEGMTIAGIAVGARHGYVYLRAEYPHAGKVLNAAIERARNAELLGDNVAGSGQSFDLEVRLGAGAYICGEETSLLESLEGKRGVVRFKPPLPAVAGLFGAPTLINNVLTLASVPAILAAGAASYASLGSGRSRGTQPFQLAGNVRYGGLVEVPFGLTLNELLYDFGGGTASGRPIRAVQVGGPLGAWVPPAHFDTPLDYEALAQRGAMLGHGGIVVFDDTVDMAQMARFAMEFCAIESCGKCTPCRIGSTRAVELIDQMIDRETGRITDRTARSGGGQGNTTREQNVELLQSLCDTMTHGSLCALGGLAPMPVLSALKHYPQDFGLPAGPDPADRQA